MSFFKKMSVVVVLASLCGTSLAEAATMPGRSAEMKLVAPISPALFPKQPLCSPVSKPGAHCVKPEIKVPPCLPKMASAQPISWTSLDFSSISEWLKRFPVANMPKTSQTGKKEPQPFSNADSKNLEVYKKALDQIIGPIPKNCVPLNLSIDSINLHLTADEMAQASITPITADGTDSGMILGYRLTPNKTVFGTSPSASDSARIFYITFSDVVGQKVAGYILVPEDAAGQIMPGSLPSVVAFHQTYNECGKKEQINACPSTVPWADFAPEMVRRGFVTIVVDMPNYGESWDQSTVENIEYNSTPVQNILKYYPRASELGIELSYTERTLEVLKQQDIVTLNDDIGIIGHSKGGTNALLAKIYFPQIKAAIVNAGGLHMFRSDDLIGDHNGIDLKGSLGRWCKYGYLPALCNYIGKIDQLPFELHHLYALALKDGALFSYQIQDDGYPKYDGLGNQMSTYWDSIDFVNTQVARIAPKINGEYHYAVKQSGRFDTYPGTKECFETAGSDIGKIEYCLTYFGYNHGVYPKDMNPFMDRFEQILKK